MKEFESILRTKILKVEMDKEELKQDFDKYQSEGILDDYKFVSGFLDGLNDALSLLQEHKIEKV